MNHSILGRPNNKIFGSDFAGDGLNGHYYQGYTIDSSGIISFDNLTEAFSRTDTIIDFWDGSQYFQWHPVAGWGSNYSVHWEG